MSYRVKKGRGQRRNRRNAAHVRTTEPRFGWKPMETCNCPRCGSHRDIRRIVAAIEKGEPY